MGCRLSKRTSGKVGVIDTFKSAHYQPLISSKTNTKFKTIAGRKDTRYLDNSTTSIQFSDFSTTSATYVKSASRASKITVRLSCDGSTLEIEKCDMSYSVIDSSDSSDNEIGTTGEKVFRSLSVPILTAVDKSDFKRANFDSMGFNLACEKQCAITVDIIPCGVELNIDSNLSSVDKDISSLLSNDSLGTNSTEVIKYQELTSRKGDFKNNKSPNQLQRHSGFKDERIFCYSDSDRGKNDVCHNKQALDKTCPYSTDRIFNGFQENSPDKISTDYNMAINCSEHGQLMDKDFDNCHRLSNKLYSLENNEWTSQNPDNVNNILKETNGAIKQSPTNLDSYIDFIRRKGERVVSKRRLFNVYQDLSFPKIPSFNDSKINNIEEQTTELDNNRISNASQRVPEECTISDTHTLLSSENQIDYFYAKTCAIKPRNKQDSDMCIHAQPVFMQTKSTRNIDLK